MHIPRVICCNCHTPMTVETISVIIEMMMRDGRPYYKISCDIYECKNCDASVALPASAPIAEAYQGDKYDAVMASKKAYFLT